MIRTVPLYLAVVLAGIGGLLLNVNGCGGKSAVVVATPPQVPPPTPSPSPSQAPGQIQHVVIIFQENRTPDNLFHDPALIAKGADIASSGINSLGQTVSLNPEPLAVDYTLNHSHKSFVS